VKFCVVAGSYNSDFDIKEEEEDFLTKLI